MFLAADRLPAAIVGAVVVALAGLAGLGKLGRGRYLQTSDHFYYMCTKFWSDGDVHKYFSPYDSPYDAYIYYMNVLADFETTVSEAEKPLKAPAAKKAVRKKEVTR